MTGDKGVGDWIVYTRDPLDSGGKKHQWETDEIQTKCIVNNTAPILTSSLGSLNYGYTRW